MEREELDQIPWSQLAAEVDDGVDRRWYAVGIGVGVIVVAVLGFRLLGGSGGQPIPVAVADTSSTLASTTTDATPEPIITEAALRAEPAPSDMGAVAVAEWFVLDLYTVDGSQETVAAIRDRVEPALADEVLAHDDPEALRTFVEWARAFDVRIDGGVTRVSVAYRRIRDIGGSFERDPVDAVVVDLVREGGAWSVAAWPAPTPVP